VKVLHLIGSLENGGAEAVLVRLVTADSDIQHRVVSIGPADWYSDMLMERGIDLHHLDLRGPAGFPAAVRRLKKLIEEFRPDLIQGWMYRANMLGGVLGKIMKVPVVWGIHCSTFGRPLRFRSRALVRLSGLVAGILPTLVVNCSTRAEAAHARIGYRRAASQVIPNGYDSAQFRPLESGEADLRAELQLPGDSFLIATVARWHAQKDQPNLLAALALVREELPTGWTCLLVGPDIGTENPALTAAIRREGLQDKVVRLGPRRDVDRIMRTIDLHVLPSAFGEAFPNVVAEAMASRTPCIVTDVGDSALLVGDTGWVVPPKSPRILADAILAAFRERTSANAAWTARREAARDRIASSFTIERMRARYEEAWSDALGIAGPTPSSSGDASARGNPDPSTAPRR
jgi:glycosyltransferase involved in cell wall biosynthesis